MAYPGDERVLESHGLGGAVRAGSPFELALDIHVLPRGLVAEQACIMSQAEYWR